MKEATLSDFIRTIADNALYAASQQQPYAIECKYIKLYEWQHHTGDTNFHKLQELSDKGVINVYEIEQGPMFEVLGMFFNIHGDF